jgi:hypothetical protein
MTDDGLRSRLAGTLPVVVAAVFLVTCGAQDPEPGKVGGCLPPCYGAGPDLNLTPSRVLEVYQDGKLV